MRERGRNRDRHIDTYMYMYTIFQVVIVDD